MSRPRLNTLLRLATKRSTNFVPLIVTHPTSMRPSEHAFRCCLLQFKHYFFPCPLFLSPLIIDKLTNTRVASTAIGYRFDDRGIGKGCDSTRLGIIKQYARPLTQSRSGYAPPSETFLCVPTSPMTRRLKFPVGGGKSIQHNQVDLCINQHTLPCWCRLDCP